MTHFQLISMNFCNLKNIETAEILEKMTTCQCTKCFCQRWLIYSVRLQLLLYTMLARVTDYNQHWAVVSPKRQIKHWCF